LELRKNGTVTRCGHILLLQPSSRRVRETGLPAGGLRTLTRPQPRAAMAGQFRGAFSARMARASAMIRWAVCSGLDSDTYFAGHWKSGRPPGVHSQTMPRANSKSGCRLAASFAASHVDNRLSKLVTKVTKGGFCHFCHRG
jgi:hypothetical protein